MNMPSYYEDFEIGASQEFGSYLVTAEEIVEFASKYDPQPFHLSDEAGKAMHFGGLCASGWHSCAIAMRMIVDNMPAAGSGSLGSPGVDELRWIRLASRYGQHLHGKSGLQSERRIGYEPQAHRYVQQKERSKINGVRVNIQ